MKRRDLERHLRQHGARLLREGGNHSFWGFGAERSAALPRHREIDFTSLGRSAAISASRRRSVRDELVADSAQDPGGPHAARDERCSYSPLAMAYELRLPDLGEGLTEGEVARWLVAEGEDVAEDQPLVEVATDKTTVEIPSPAAGRVGRIQVAEGEVVPVGTLLVAIGEDGAASEARAKVQATPLVRRIARELGVDIDTLGGTGPDGRVTEDDVRAAARGSSESPPGEARREKLRGVRRQIAEHLTRSHREIPAVTFVEECDFASVDMALLLPTVLRAAALALREFPELNARLDGDEIVLLDRYDVGIAVQTDEGLLVPVVRGCDEHTVEELRADIDRLADAARAGTLAPEELRGSTFSVTSAGKLGGIVVTPLINHPNVAILGVHRIAQRPVVRAGEIVVRPVGNVSVTFDHRVVDGARAAEFALAVIARLEAGG